MAFKVGDTVEFNFAGRMAQGEIAFGPFTRLTMAGEWCLVRRSDGTYSMHNSERLTAIPKFQVGDLVRTTYNAEYTIAAGPFKTAAGSAFMIRNEQGDHHLHIAETLTKVENTYIYDGITYDLDARYRDFDGDEWALQMKDGQVMAGMAAYSDIDYTWTLGRLICKYGPLTKV
jgi:hypothetical protein